jgi:hypothetical protein
MEENMKKLLFITVFLCLALAVFAASPRVYMQKLTLTDGTMPGNPADANPIPNYNLSVFISTDPGTVFSTATNGNPANICLKRTGSSPNFYVVAYLNQSIFPVNWTVGATLDMTVTYTTTGETLHWTKVVPSGTGAILDTSVALIAPPYPPAGNPPNAPTLGTPTGTIGYASAVTVGWTASVVDGTHSAATSYDVYFGTTLPSTPNANVVGTSWNAGAVVQNTTYQVKVIARNAFGSGVSTPLTWSFQTRAEYNPYAATAVAPGMGNIFSTIWPAATYNMALVWNAPVTDATHPAPTGYKVYLGLTNPPTALVATQPTTIYNANSLGVGHWHYTSLKLWFQTCQKNNPKK